MKDKVNDEGPGRMAALPSAGEIRRQASEMVTLAVAIARRLGWIDGQLDAAENPPSPAELDLLRAEQEEVLGRIATAEARMREALSGLGEPIAHPAPEAPATHNGQCAMLAGVQ